MNNQSKLNQLLLRRAAKKKHVNIDKKAIVFKDNVYEGMNNIHDYTTFIGKLGFGSYICLHCYIHADIGRYVSIADNVQTIIGTHPTSKIVSTHPAFYSVDPLNAFVYVDNQKYEERKFAKDTYPVVIGNDVWIGYGASIMQGVTIGDGAIIGAHALVTKDVPPYAIVAGMPAKIIRYRFPQNQIDFLMKFKWWNKDEKWIKENHELFLDIEKFMAKYDK